MSREAMQLALETESNYIGLNQRLGDGQAISRPSTPHHQSVNGLVCMEVKYQTPTNMTLCLMKVGGGQRRN
jgi:hypothetical protein